MKRSFPPPAQEALAVLVGALVCGAACTPSHDVKPGAPQLVEFNIVQAGQPTPSGLGTTTITPDTPECATIASGAPCLPMGSMADADGGTGAPPDSLCRLASANNWCLCVADGMDPAKGAWNCDPFANVMAVVAVFDRLLDTAPLDPGDAAALSDVVTATEGPNATPVALAADYGSNGQASGLVFNVYGPFFGNFRADGPSLMAAPVPIPAFPSGTTFTVSLDAGKILAKDGTTPFEAGGLLMSRSVVFTTTAFTAAIVPPDPMDPTAVTATIVFTNLVEPASCPSQDPANPMGPPIPCLTAAHIIAVDRSGAPPFPSVPIDVASAGGAIVTVTPSAGSWPPGAPIEITVDGAITNVLGQTITAAASATFTAP